ncbi:MAG: carbohydrate-binding family 9-like protein [Lentisphaeria bacterium]|nr:carbohydrate-binding family 9-like protein [Lentisphaeria bacterium]
MKKQFLITVFVLLCFSLAAQIKELSFYEVRPKNGNILIDGKIEEKAWQNIPVHGNYYEYYKDNPKPGLLKTTYRMVYDEKGLYMAVVNYEDNISALKRDVTEYDKLEIWQDDCGEFHFDPLANGIGYTKITINANGVFHDMRRQDTAVYLNEWSGYGTVTAASVGKDAWYIEAFFPWSVLDGVGRNGDLWQFCHTRYSWTKKFRGMTSSPGGNYNATDKFGYLYFSDGKTALDPAKIGALLQTKAAVPWCIPCGNILVSCTGNVLKLDELSGLLKQEREKYRLGLMEIAALNDKSSAKPIAALKKEIAAAEPYQGMVLYNALLQANTTLFDLKWQILFNKNFK